MSGTSDSQDWMQMSAGQRMQAGIDALRVVAMASQQKPLSQKEAAFAIGSEDGAQTLPRMRKAGTSGKFELYSDEDGDYRFRLKARNGQVILASESYKTKSGALRALHAVPEYTQNADVIDLSEEKKRRGTSAATR